VIAPALLATTAAAFALAAAFQGRAFFALRFAPTRHTGAALAAGGLPALLSTGLLFLEQGSLPYHLVLWLGIFGLCGFAIPWAYVLGVEGGTLADLGIHGRRWKASLLLSLVFAAGSLVPVLRADLSKYEPSHLLGALVHLNVGGLFELFLYYGFLHLRLRDAFGALPAIVGSAATYSLWHIGTELPLHPHPAFALLMLFAVGLLCHALFATTCNLLVIWPFFFSAGVMNDFILNLDLPEVIGRDLSWPALGWGLAVLVPGGIWAYVRARKRGVGLQGARYVAQRLVLLAIFAALLFVSAGRLDWTRAWAYLAAVLLCESATLALLAARAPETLNRRGTASSGVPRFDKAFVVLWLLLSFATPVVAGLEVRFDSSSLPWPGFVVGLVVLLPATAFASWAMLENEHFEQLVRIQTDRGHRVVTTGPYRFVRHPGYLAAIAGALATPLMLGSAWTFVPAGLVAALFAVRTQLEDRTLRRELAGYEEYARRTRFRLVPGVW
jgi:protein-S-isoprenylcysteine O-methyltransferase Ste14